MLKKQRICALYACLLQYYGSQHDALPDVVAKKNRRDILCLKIGLILKQIFTVRMRMYSLFALPYMAEIAKS